MAEEERTLEVIKRLMDSLHPFEIDMSEYGVEFQQMDCLIIENTKTTFNHVQSYRQIHEKVRLEISCNFFPI